jgi:Ala-tRNA(Pro) deacylase
MSHADRPDPDTIKLSNGQPAATVEHVLNALNELNIEHHTITHDALFTVEQAKQVKFDLPGAHTKNLFLRNKKGRMFLLVVEPDHMVDLRGLRDKLTLPGGQFAFASTERLGKFLGVVPGSVSPFGLINDHDGLVQLYMQNTLLQHEWIYMHPCRNTHSTRIRTSDLLRVLEHWNHPVTEISFDSDS